jgi:hypothetical protein
VPQLRRPVAALLALSALAALAAGAAGAARKPVKARKTEAAKKAVIAKGDRVTTASFEGSLVGWGGNHASLSLVTGGYLGKYAARVSLSGTSSDFSIFPSPMQVDSTVAGATYFGQARVRSAKPGNSVCIRMREWTQDLRSQVTSKLSCVTTTAAWQAFPVVSIRAQAAGHHVDLYVYESPTKPGDSFDVDAVAVATTPPAAPPTPPTPPAPDFRTGRGFFPQSSVLTTPIPASPQLSPISDRQVATIVSAVADKGWALGNREWNATVYHADASTPLRTVRYVNYTSGARQPWYGYGYTQIPIPDNARPTPDSDHKMVVVDEANQCVYDFGGYVSRSADGSWTATAANGIDMAGSGVYPNSNSPSAGGFSYAAGMFTPQEIAAGQINHALIYAGPVFNGSAVAPASGSDEAPRGLIPEGARVQLDPSLNLDDPSLGLAPWQKTIARALQVYGMYGMDAGGAVALMSESADSGDGLYPWDASAFGYLPIELARHLRVLAYGSQFANNYTYVPQRCNTLYR